MACKAPVCWLKYTTNKVLFLSRGDWKGEASCEIITLRQEIAKWGKFKNILLDDIKG